MQTDTDSSWNMAKGYMISLRGLMDSANISALGSDCRDWFMKDLRLYAEVHPKIKKIKESGLTEKDHENQIKKIKKLVSRSLITAKTLNSNPDYSKVYEALHQWDIMLKDSMDKVSLLTPSEGDPRYR